ncbi:hypothetical protein COOONC_12805 [Cooperia oncophora]
MEDENVTTPNSASVYFQCIPTPPTVTSTAQIVISPSEDLEETATQNEEHSGSRSPRGKRSHLLHETLFDEQERLVTAENVSSSMFSDNVLTGIEAPEVARMLELERKEMKPSGMRGAKKGNVQRLRDLFETMHRTTTEDTRMPKKKEKDGKLAVHQH